MQISVFGFLGDGAGRSPVDVLWVPRTVSPSLIRAFPAGGPDHLGSGPAQHDRQLWPSDSPI